MKIWFYWIFLWLASVIVFLLGINFYVLKKMFIMEWLIFKFNSMNMNLFILFDFKSLIFTSMVMFITSMVYLYSKEYMKVKIYMLDRFIYLILLFMISMIFMILSPSMLSILLGWDGLGLISYCLIIYYQNFKSLNSGMLTILLNRLGDALLLMMISLMTMMGSWNLLMYNMDNLMMMMIVLMAFTKSAQLPFSSWLPAAMMAPTPVSSLVHSSTLVTAGVYLLIRYYELLDEKINLNILMISSFTMFMAGLIANFEYDLKKIVALSTLSQLGFMMSILSVGFVDLAFLHLLIHALFKSLMFLSVGSVIHFMNGSQDLRDYGGLFKLYPFKMTVILFSMMSLCGFPFLVGFYSKDLIMEEFFYVNMNLFSMMNLILGTMFTIMYSFRLMMFMKYNFMSNLNMILFKESILMMISMIMILLFSIIFSNLFLEFSFYMNISFLENLLKLMIFKLCLLGFMMMIYLMKMSLMNYLSEFFNQMFYLNKFYKINLFSNLMLFDSYVENSYYFNFSNIFIMFMNLIKMKKLKINFFSMILFYMLFMMMLLFIL
uniref:NADH dehydrogenase subunit 5 n=1 Tax=Tetrapedia diversipes TaxID=889126 RepID=UPI001EF9CF34|nr:NADH dehydrogenase subunit 5 [Tetrapedia diversipes]UKG21060.1 NADH dehydrogenase subunit 5 [Tetrapedia diversipes]